MTLRSPWPVSAFVVAASLAAGVAAGPSSAAAARPTAAAESMFVGIGGLISHAFFRPWRLTFDFDAMELVLSPPA